MADIGVVYLCRFAEGEAPAKKFLASYFDHPAGIEHDLHVIFKGFPDQRALASRQSLFGELPINPIKLDDTGYDIGSYIAAARAVQSRRLIFLNSFSEILGANWLCNFDRALSHPGAGVVGATGSWQASSSSVERAIVSLLYNTGHLPAYVRRRREHGWRKAGQVTGLQRPKRPLSRYLLFPLTYPLNRYEFGRYPNPHLRTNAFMIDRQYFLSLRFPSFQSKRGALKFESGRQSMTRQIVARGLRPLVVDRAGRVHDVSEWKASFTFHAGDQQNLIVSDNRTREYAAASFAYRSFLEKQAWNHPWSWHVRPWP